MQFLIFSDTHGRSQNIINVIERCIADLDGVIFLGDNYPDIIPAMERFPDLTFHAVAGNCDFGARYLAPEYQEKLVDIGGVRVLMLHGHTRSVKFYLGELEAYARRVGADVALFGHTHERVEEYRHLGSKPLHLFNPGSAALPKDGLPPSFGVLCVVNGQVLLSHGDV